MIGREGQVNCLLLTSGTGKLCQTVNSKTIGVDAGSPLQSLAIFVDSEDPAVQLIAPKLFGKIKNMPGNIEPFLAWLDTVIKS